MTVLSALISGLVMALGLIVSGMIDPAKVRAFLDIFGAFDATLFFVMAGALLITVLGFNFKPCQKPFLCERFDLPAKKKIDAPLILGALFFGAGWGLAGFCPGPALAGLGLGRVEIFIFVIAMLAGMMAAQLIIRRKSN